jgi:nitrogen fixation protein FixH
MIVPVPARLRGRHVLSMVIGFFAAIMAVNAVMVWYALGTFPGTVSDNAYREGLEYNRTLEERAAQRALGWHVSVEVAGTGLKRRIEARFKNRDGAPLSGMKVAARLTRPVARGADRVLELRESAPGIYGAEAEFPRPGHWQLDVEAHRDAATWTMERELWVK